MKVKIEYRASFMKEIIDLEDYGYDEETKWSDLTEEQQNEITDTLNDLNQVTCSAEDYEQ